MAIEIPSEVVLFLNFAGVPYPDVDEDQVRELAQQMREFAGRVRQTHESATGAINDMGSVYSGYSYRQLVAAWGRMSNTHMAELDRTCEVVARALHAAATLITVVKAAVLAELAALAAVYGSSLAATIATSGLAAALTQAVTVAARKLVGVMEQVLLAYLAAEVLGKAIEPLEQVVADMINRVTYRAVTDLLDVPEDGASVQPLSIEPDEVSRYADMLNGFADDILAHASDFANKVGELDFTTGGARYPGEASGSYPPVVPAASPSRTPYVSADFPPSVAVQRAAPSPALSDPAANDRVLVRTGTGSSVPLGAAEDVPRQGDPPDRGAGARPLPSTPEALVSRALPPAVPSSDPPADLPVMSAAGPSATREPVVDGELGAVPRAGAPSASPGPAVPSAWGDPAVASSPATAPANAVLATAAHGDGAVSSAVPERPSSGASFAPPLPGTTGPTLSAAELGAVPMVAPPPDGAGSPTPRERAGPGAQSLRGAPEHPARQHGSGPSTRSGTGTRKSPWHARAGGRANSRTALGDSGDPPAMTAAPVDIRSNPGTPWSKPVPQHGRPPTVFAPDAGPPAPVLGDDRAIHRGPGDSASPAPVGRA
ncbi:WXG100-like domain-containing protein [Nocardia sp. NPDC003693]